MSLRRLEGLARHVREMIEEPDACCPTVLEQVLAMQGHVKQLQGLILESHLNTCAEEKLKSKQKGAFIKELIHAIGLSTRR